MEESKIREAVWQTIVKRQTHRLKFKEQPITDEHLGKIIEAFRWGPSPHTIQPAEAILINDQTLIHKIADLTTQAAKLTYADGDYWRETYPWLRFSEEEFEQGVEVCVPTNSELSLRVI